MTRGQEGGRVRGFKTLLSLFNEEMKEERTGEGEELRQCDAKAGKTFFFFFFFFGSNKKRNLPLKK